MAVTATDEWLQRDAEALATVLPRVFDVVVDHGQGSWIVDIEGRRFLDLTSGIAVTTTGHCHPRVVAAVQEQAARLLHISVVTHNQQAVRLAERLGALVPFFEDAQAFFCNSGAEAVDGGLKLARRVTGRPGIVAFRHGFHGRTFGATSVTTAKPKYRFGYEPLVPAVHIAPYCHGDVDAALGALDAMLASQAPPEGIGAMLVEPMLGEGGYVVPPVEWLRGLRERCDRHGILLIFDEVQTGIGRTGAPFAAETFGVFPDVLLFAKGIASGLPLGGILAPAALLARWPTGAHGSTFGGNPVACAAALATLDVLEEEGLCERAARLGGRAATALKAATAEIGEVVEVRGLGLMIGVELVDADAAKAVQAACFDEGVLILTCGPGDNVLRVVPPLTVTEEELDMGTAVLADALRGLRGTARPAPAAALASG